MKLKGKTALVTGGTDGIGAELIRQLRGKGTQVITSGRTPERIATTREAGFEVIEADLSTPQGIDALLAGLAGRPIDLLINNAGMMDRYDVRVAAPDLRIADQAVFLNLQAPIHLIAVLLPMLRARPEAAIVNVTSGNAIAPRAAMPVYSATKAGLSSFTQALRYQLRETNIHVIEALPPSVDTRMNTRRGSRMPAAECARRIVGAIERNAAVVNIGQTKLLCLANAISPALARWIMLRY